MVLDSISYYNFESDMYPLGDASRAHLGSFGDFGGRMHKLYKVDLSSASVKNRKIKWNYPNRSYYYDVDSAGRY